jgi:hypothetical protein
LLGGVKMDNILTKEIVIQAIRWASIQNNPELLWETYAGKMPQECIAAIKAIQNHDEQFRQLIRERLEKLPLTKEYFGSLIEARLKQKGILESPIFSQIFSDPRESELEQRLNNIQVVSGVESLRTEYPGSNNPKPLKGNDTDLAMYSLLAEITTLDFLISLGFVNIHKVIAPQTGIAHVDISAERDGQNYCIEVIRKPENNGWKINSDMGLETGLEDCQSYKNQKKIWLSGICRDSDTDDTEFTEKA